MPYSSPSRRHVVTVEVVDTLKRMLALHEEGMSWEEVGHEFDFTSDAHVAFAGLLTGHEVAADARKALSWLRGRYRYHLHLRTCLECGINNPLQLFRGE